MHWYISLGEGDRRICMDTSLGSVDVSAQPQQNGSKGQHFHEMTGFFLVASSNATKVLELAKHAFDDVTLLVQVPVTASLFLAIGLGWNHCRLSHAARASQAGH